MSNSTKHDHEHQDMESGQQTDQAAKDGTDSDAPAPFAPDSDDDSPLGDTDEHSDA